MLWRFCDTSHLLAWFPEENREYVVTTSISPSLQSIFAPSKKNKKPKITKTNQKPQKKFTVIPTGHHRGIPTRRDHTGTPHRAQAPAKNRVLNLADHGMAHFHHIRKIQWGGTEEAVTDTIRTHPQTQDVAGMNFFCLSHAPMAFPAHRNRNIEG